jgi:hypothetical protein
MSLLEAERLADPAIPDEAHVRRFAERLLDEVEAEPPVDVHLLASMRGIVSVDEREQPWAGMLSHRDGRFRVEVRAGDSRERQRFTILHEATHTYCPGFLERRFRCGPPGSKEHLEALCDHGASELLLPRRHFEPELLDMGLSLDTVLELAPRYVASVEATAIRAVDVWPGDAAVFVFRRRTKPSEAGIADAEPKLRLDWSHRSGRWPFIPRYKSVTDESLFADATWGEPIDGRSDLRELTGDEETMFDISARLIGERVVAIVRPAVARAA